MGSESIAIDSEAMIVCYTAVFSVVATKIQLVGQKYQDKTT